MGSVLEEQDETEGYDGLYSMELEDIATRCLYRDPAQRVEPQTLLEEVRKGRLDCTAQLDGGKYSTCTDDEMHRWYRVRFLEDDFAASSTSSTKRRSAQ
jgi:hypothetical protein